MDLQRLQALGAFTVLLNSSGNQTDAPVLNAPKLQDNGGNTVVDKKSEWVIVAILFSADQAGSFYLENANGGGAAQITPTFYFPNNALIPQVECFIPVGQGLPIQITGTIPGHHSLQLYLIRKNYNTPASREMAPGT